MKYFVILLTSCNVLGFSKIYVLMENGIEIICPFL